MFSRRSDTDVAKVDAKGGRGGGRGAARASTSPAPASSAAESAADRTAAASRRRAAPSLSPPLLSRSLVGTPTVALRPSPLLGTISLFLEQESDHNLTTSLIKMIEIMIFSTFTLYLNSATIARAAAARPLSAALPVRAGPTSGRVHCLCARLLLFSLSLCLRISRAFFAEKAGRTDTALPLSLTSPRMHV